VVTRTDRLRSWLYAPGHDEKRLRRVPEVGGDPQQGYKWLVAVRPPVITRAIRADTGEVGAFVRDGMPAMMGGMMGD